MFTNLISKIHDCSQAEDILQAGVESVKQAIGCDRALVYSVQPETLGKILAESVAPGFPSTLDTVIDDPCFAARHIDTYRKGRITSIENIETARITPCYVENLQKLAVKANLVLPLLLPDNELYGLLILHQCSQPRVWEQSEITLSAQMAAQMGWALDNAIRWSESRKIQMALDRHKHYTGLIEAATQKIHQGNTRIEVLEIATAQVQSVLGCDRAIVYAIERSHLGTIIAESKLPALSSINGMTIEDPCFEFEYVDKYQQGEVQAIDNIHEAGISAHLVENLVKIAVKSNIVVPIIGNKNELYGLLAAHQCFNIRSWHEMEVELLRQIGIQTGLALAKARAQEEVSTMKSSLKRAGIVKDTIVNADTQLQHVKESLTTSVETLDEAKHLMRLLSNEVISLTEKFSPEDLNLVRIIAKKLQGNTEKATTGALSLQSNIAELETAIDSAIKVYKTSRKAS
jgi:GAF domain-containing protein